MTYSTQLIEITTHDGIKIRGNLTKPLDTSTPRPLIVLPSSWGINQIEYLPNVYPLAERGFIAISYTNRGFYESEGEINVAGPLEVQDVSTVIDWALANANVDPTRIATAGISYGAGLGLMAASKDRRIRAVAAMSTWTDLIESLYADTTRHTQAQLMLDTLGQLTGRISAESAQIFKNFQEGTQIEELKQWAAVRSPSTYIDKLNEYNPAIFIANAWTDTLFGPNAVFDYFNKLTVSNKRIEMLQGDHGVASWDSCYAWFEKHLMQTGQISNGVQLKTITDPNVENYAALANISTSSKTYYFQGRVFLTNFSKLGSSPVSFSNNFMVGTGSLASAGTVIVTNFITLLTQQPPLCYIPLLNIANCAVWQSDTLSSPMKIRGSMEVKMSIKASATKGTVVVYVYEVDALGAGSLIAHSPFSWIGSNADITLNISSIGYNISKGKKIAVVVDGKDTLYGTDNSFTDMYSITSGSIKIPLI